MTQHKKCDTCRSRKVKCDEKHPVCGNCAKKGRPCYYSFDGPVKFVKEDPCKKREDLGGPLHKSWPCLAVPKPMPPSQTAKRGMQWAAMIGTQPLYKNPMLMFGTWITDIPARIGSNNTVDAAVSCVINSHQAVLHRTDEAYHVAWLSGLYALKGLRSTMKKKKKIDLDLLLTVKLLYISEQLSQELQLYGPPLLNDGLAWSLYRSLAFDEAIEALLADSDSTFDNPTWLGSIQTQLDNVYAEGSAFDTISLVIMRNMARIPGLVRLVRFCQLCPNDSAACNEAVELFRAVSQDCCEAEIAEVLQQSARCIPTTASHAWVVSHSWYFDSYRTFELVALYWAHRVLLCGVAERLCLTVPTATAHIDLETIYTSDQHAALSIAMCLEYTSFLDEAQPLQMSALRMVPLLQVCYGTWSRRRKRQAAENPAPEDQAPENTDLERTTRVGLWFLDLSNAISGMWRIIPAEQPHMDLIMETLAGGPFPDSMRNRGSPAAILTSREQKLEKLKAYGIR